MFPTKGSAFGGMADLIKRGLEEDQALTDKRTEKVGAIVDDIENTLKPKGGLKLSVKDRADAEAFIDKAIHTKGGETGVKYNQHRIAPVPMDVVEYVKAASDGRLDISGKYFALHGSHLNHEFVRHSNKADEIPRDQIAWTEESYKGIIDAMFQPDVVEYMGNPIPKVESRKTFVLAKHTKAGSTVVLAEAVGGRDNPNIIPVIAVQITENKWNRIVREGLSFADLLYENDRHYVKDAETSAQNAKNRVTVANHASELTPDPITPEARLHSPRFDLILSPSSNKVNQNTTYE